MNYKIIGFRLMDPAKLSPHPDAEMPIDPKDYDGLREGIAENGIVAPLLVVGKKVIDGCNRLLAAQELKLPKVPCLLVKCDNVRAVSAETLTRGRQRSTGQRIMVYLEMNKAAVLKQFREDLGGQLQSRDGSSVREFGQRAIAARLRVSDKDVGIGLELLDALNGGTNNGATEPLDKDAIKAVEDVRRNLLAGTTPIRRAWAAARGKAHTEGNERIPTNYDNVLERSVKGLLSAVTHSDQLSTDKLAEIEPIWAKALKKLPDSMLKILKSTIGKS